MNIIIKKNLLLYKGYKLKCSIGKSGSTHIKKEGDCATPKGLFKLGLLYYRKDRIKSIKSLLIKRVIKHRAEKLYRKDKIYDIFINIKYNQSPVVKGKGSAIFLHLSRKNYLPTKGCVSILKKDFYKILPLINKRTKILII